MFNREAVELAYWLLGITIAGVTILAFIFRTHFKVKSHIEDEDIHLTTQMLDDRYYPRELMSEKLNSIQTSFSDNLKNLTKSVDAIRTDAEEDLKQLKIDLTERIDRVQKENRDTQAHIISKIDRLIKNGKS